MKQPDGRVCHVKSKAERKQEGNLALPRIKRIPSLSFA